MRDYLPADMQRRQFVINTITDVFQTYGFEPIQTPVMELTETLLGKYGEDAEKLIYHAQHPGSKEELALRYDLTVPLTRFFAMNENALPLPFKRYHIAPVWRGERPQRGRYREFYQCDADIVGIAGPEADAEAIAVTVTGIRRLGFDDFVTKVNSRKLLTAIGEYAGVPADQRGALYRTIDKADKIGLDGVRAEFLEAGMDADVIARMTELLAAGMNQIGIEAGRQTLAMLRDRMQAIPAAREAVGALEAVLDTLTYMGDIGTHVGLDFTMVRGLGYYTGTIFESVLLSTDPEERMGSISGGGRYDDLIGLYRKESLPTVGTSFGIERLIDLMDVRQMYPASIRGTVVQVLVTVFSPETKPASLAAVTALRAAGLRTELYMQDKALGKQVNYADKKQIPLIAVIGPDEMAAGLVKLKRLTDGLEVSIPASEAPGKAAELLRGL
jgi:histidyl-tRNA synthetase